MNESDLPALGCAYVESFKSVDPSEEWTSERAVALNLDFPLSWYLRLGFEAKSDWQVMLGDVKRVIRGLKGSV